MDKTMKDMKQAIAQIRSSANYIRTRTDAELAGMIRSMSDLDLAEHFGAVDFHLPAVTPLSDRIATPSVVNVTNITNVTSKRRANKTLILERLKRGPVRMSDLRALGMSTSRIYSNLKALMAEGRVVCTGRPHASNRRYSLASSV